MVKHAESPLYVIVLAAGKGTRMKSSKPKVLHEIGHKPMLGHVLDSINGLEPESVFVVCGHGSDQLKDWAREESRDIQWVEQAEQKGTGHAVAVCLPSLKQANVAANATILVVSSDVPLTKTETLQALVNDLHDVALLTIDIENPYGYGRVLRDEHGALVGVVEEKDSTDSQRQIQEVNTNVMCFKMAILEQLLPCLENNNAQGEYYLPDFIGHAYNAGINIVSNKAANVWEVQGVNDRAQLQALERVYQKNRAQDYMMAGLGLFDADRFDLRGDLQFGQDCVCDINTVIEGSVILGNNVQIGPNVRLKNVVINDNTRILGFSDIEGAEIGIDCQVGPFARIRAGTKLGNKSKIGNFVETKNANFGEEAKASHLTYAGDCQVGAKANIGAGTIFCNYNGVNKNLTTIGSDAFIGSNVSLVAPVIIGDGATIGAGSTITQDVPNGVLVVARSSAKVIDTWERPTKD